MFSYAGPGARCAQSAMRRRTRYQAAARAMSDRAADFSAKMPQVCESVVSLVSFASPESYRTSGASLTTEKELPSNSY